MSQTIYKLIPLWLLLFVAHAVVVAQPLNDDCLNATPIAIPASGGICLNGNNTGATSTTWGSAVCGQTNWTNDVWYTFVSNGSLNTITVRPTGSPAASKVGVTVYTGSCGSLTGLGTYCAISPNNTDSVKIIQASTIGTQYFVEVSSFNGDGNFQLCINSVTPQPSPGSSCATASQICALNPFSLASGPSGTGGFTPDCFLFGANSSVWYKFTVGVSGTLAWSATPKLANTELDWALYDITSSCPGAFTSPVACNYNYGNEGSNPIGMNASSTTICPADGANGAPEEICPSITVTAGKTYAIVIDNFSNNGSGWDFNWTGSTFGLAPTSQFTTTPSSICGSAGTVNITNTTIGGTTQVWNFGDGSANYTGSAPPAHTYTAPGTYVISNQVTNNGCTDVSTQSVQIIANPTVTVNSTSVCAGKSATLTATPSNTGGTYSWAPGGATTQSITVSPATNATYTVTYTLLNCSGTGTGTITVNPKPNAGADQTVVCLTTDVATMAATGTGTWSALASNPGTAAITTATSPTTTITSFSVVGTYKYVWTSASGCTDTASVVVGNACGCANPPTVTISPKTGSICAGQTQVVSGIFGGSATQVSYSSSGTGTFSAATASASPFNVTYTPSTADNTAGTVTLYATTNNPLGSPCPIRVDSFVLTINPAPIATASNTGPYCAGATVALSSGGGSSYSWSGPLAYANGTQNPLLTNATTTMAGVYTVTVTSAATCTATATTTVVVNANPTATASNAGPYCPGTTIALTGGAAGNTYSWSGPNSFTNATQSPSITGATAIMGGTYTITVTSAANCTATASTNVVINAAPSASASNTGPYCEGATISLTGGVSGLTSYAWSGPNAYSNGTQSPSISSSTPAMSGVYTITVTDASSCTATAATTVEVNPLPQISAVATNTICTANNGMVVVTVNSGGTPGFNYTWSPANIDNDTINGLGVNTYNVTVTDSKNCSAAATANVGLTTNPVPITLDRIVNVKCNGLSTGEIDVTVGTGALAYTYLWNPTAQSTEDATGLSAGAYTLIAADQFGCVDSAHYTVTEPTALNLSVASHTDASCNGGSNGTATLTVFGGSGTYHFLWNDPSVQTSATATGLAAGTYTATVTDDSACVATTSVTIAEPTAVTFATPTIVSPLCFRSADGSITSSGSGGTGAINYSWSHNIGLNNTLASPLDTGVYFQIATDGNGCSDTAYFHIQDPTPIQFNAATVVDVNCNGAKDGSISSTAQGGTGTLTYGWNFDPTLNLTNLVGLDTGTYVHYATDINGCKDSAIYTIHEPTAVIFQAATIVNVSCNGGNDGSITSVASGGTGVITYSWSHDITLNSSTATNLTAGTYTQTATDANGCSITNTFTVTEPTAVTFGIPQLVMVTCNGGSDATITSAASGGTGVISYTWSHDGTLNSSIATGLIAGIYGQTATDANGCSATTSFTVTEPTPIVFINPSVQDVKCHGENTGSIHSEATGGTGNIQYGWSHNLGLNSPDALNLIQGTYYQIATDANGCKDTSNLFVVNEPTQLTLLANATPELCIGAANGTITSIAGGGTPGYSFDLTLGGAIIQTNASGSFSSLSPATYIVDVTDANGCVEMQTATVYSQEHDMFTVDVDSTSCYGSQYKDGVIRVESQTLLNGPYQYSIDNGKTYSYVSDFYNLSAGVYTVFAKNNNGCDTSFIVEVPEPLPATLAIIPNDTSIHIGEQIGLAIQLYPYPTSSITSYHWTPAAGLSCDDCPNPTMTSYQKNNTYLLEVTYSNECKASAIATINIKSDTSLYIPNAFSPNGDGNNDLFEVYGRELKTVHMEVFNRWGEKVYDSMGNPFASWDGKYKGELQPPSVYVFSVEVEYLNAKKDRRSGSVTLIR
ncbi:MAG: gliding motility-associated C-terminal domain-containing protein [Chitinophagales bacterium]